MNLRCLIIDDDTLARKSMSLHAKKIDFLDLVGVCSDTKSARNYLQTDDIDLIFLDVEMPEETGIEFLRTLPVLPQVIFTTSKTDYAFEAFEFQATDYLVKPISFERFRQASEKALRFSEYAGAKSNSVDIFFKSDKRYVRVPFDDILYIENLGDYVLVVTTKDKIVVHSTVKAIDAKLPQNQFYRVHRSFIVNVHKIVDIEESTLVIDKKVIPISRNNRPDFLDKLNIL